MKRITSIRHNGVMFPPYQPMGFTIRCRGRQVKLTPEQEEMAVAWVKKIGTPQAEDPVFVKNFFGDFCRALGLEETLGPQDFDFSEVVKWVENERKKKESMTKEEKKRLAEERKRLREENREKYGYVLINGERVELGNYAVEPPCIFVGRGKHPLRGRWKPRIYPEDVVLNLSPDAPTPPLPDGRKWGGRVFDPEALWVAKWKDKLTGKTKYIWISEASVFRQEREIEKFNTARKLERMLGKIREHIERELASEDVKRRKIATVAYLIDELRMRVGDEKDEDELDTVGATTLRGSHIKIDDSGTVRFDFLGKDAVRWVREIRPPKQVLDNLREFIKGPRDQVFDGIRSEDVNAFFSEVVPGLTAKVFRTYHATRAVKEYLSKNSVRAEDPEVKKKYVAKMANLQAAVTCNHKRKLPKNWRQSLEKKMKRLRELREQLRQARLKKGRSRRRIEALKRRIAALELNIELARATRDYNLNTSLKSYVDPRVFIRWAERVGYDWRRIYPKGLQRKFTWAESSRNDSAAEEL
jgi:DNA topoisomerase-1